MTTESRIILPDEWEERLLAQKLAQERHTFLDTFLELICGLFHIFDSVISYILLVTILCSTVYLWQCFSSLYLHQMNVR